MEPRFSIIVPIYNVKSYLLECLESIRLQSVQDFEAILVDDVSTDGSREMAQEYVQAYPEKFRLIAHKVNTRQGGARNTGLDIARGQYVMFLDSDDYLTSNALEVIDQAIRQEDPDIVEFGHLWVDQDGRFLRKDKRAAQIATGDGKVKPMLLSTFGPCNKAYRNYLFADGKIRFPHKYYYEDYWTIPKLLLRAQKVVYLPDALYGYRQHPNSTMHDTNAEKNRDIMLGTDSLLEYFKENNIAPDRYMELEYIAVEHVLINATLRVNGIDRRSPLQKELKDFVENRFPDYRKNPYLPALPPRKRALLKRIEKEQFRLLYLQYHCRNRITDWVKRILGKLKGR